MLLSFFWSRFTVLNPSILRHSVSAPVYSDSDKGLVILPDPGVSLDKAAPSEHVSGQRNHESCW